MVNAISLMHTVRLADGTKFSFKDKAAFDSYKKQLTENPANKPLPQPTGSEPRPMPTNMQMLKNLGTTAADLVKGGIASNKLKQARIDICRNCEFLDRTTERCTKCGCFIKAKAAVAQSGCPAGRWPGEQPKDTLEPSSQGLYQISRPYQTTKEI